MRWDAEVITFDFSRWILGRCLRICRLLSVVNLNREKSSNAFGYWYIYFTRCSHITHCPLDPSVPSGCAIQASWPILRSLSRRQLTSLGFRDRFSLSSNIAAPKDEDQRCEKAHFRPPRGVYGLSCWSGLPTSVDSPRPVRVRRKSLALESPFIFYANRLGNF